MKKTLTAVIACAAFLAPTALAGVNGSMQKLTTDAASFHSTLAADAQKFVSDARSLHGTKDKAAATTLLTSDFNKLEADLKAGHLALSAARAQVIKDLEALPKPTKAQAEARRQTLLRVLATVRAEAQDAKTAAASMVRAVGALQASVKK